MTVVLLLVKATLLLGFVGIALRLCGTRVSAATRHLAWTFAVLALLTLPLASVTLPAWTAVRLPEGLATATLTPAREVDAPAASASTDVAVSGSPVEPDTVTPARVDTGGAGSFTTTSRGFLRDVPWMLALTLIYACGVLLLLTQLIAQRWSIAQLARTATEVRDPEWTEMIASCAARVGVRGPVRVLRSASETMPMAFGILHPSIMVPAIADTWDTDRREAVLLHELAHVARYDCITQMLATLACAIYWMHPGVWWVASRLRAERELACDDAVLTSGAGAREYASHLLELAYDLRSDIAPALAVSMASPRQLEGRMLAVLDRARNRATPALAWRLGGLVLTTAVLIPLATASTATSTAAAMEGLYPEDRVPAAAPAAPALPAAPAPAAQAQQATPPPPPPVPVRLQPGTWEIRPSDERGSVYLRMTERDGSHGSSIDIARLNGLAPSLLTGSGGQAAFSLRRDAGTFNFEGLFRGGVGGGTYTFVPNQAFAADMAKRGIERPTNDDLRELAYADVGPAFLDELANQRYEHPSLAQLIRAAQHGVTPTYLRDMGALGYRTGRLDRLVELRDHGVTPDYVRSLKGLGYRPADLDALVTLRDHGITPDYVKEIRDLGFNLTLEQLTDARNHGITPEYVRGLSALGYKGLSMDALISLRNHGITPDYVQELNAVGRSRLQPDQLVMLRNHGISADYIRDLNALGYGDLRLEDLVSLRNHGVTRDQIARANQRAGTRLSVDRLTDMASRGWR